MITNETFEQAYNDLNNKKIINRVLSRYSYIDREELIGCGLRALFYALKDYNNKKCKFTSYLYNKVDWECKSLLRKAKQRELKKKTVDNYDDIDFIHLVDELNSLPSLYQGIVRDRLVARMTFKEIAKNRGIAVSTARLRFLKGISILRGYYQED